VVSITDFGMLDQGQPYFVMELLEGLTLSSVMRERGALEPEFVVGVARSVANALGAAHEVGVIHRDLKPDNIILLGDAGSPTSLKVLDFGLAKLLGANRVTRDDVVYGTPQYMSPEQASGEELDPRVDVYALGILMYEMATGRVPFEADSYMGVLTQQLYAEPIPPSQLRPELSRCPGLEAIVLACLRKQRDERMPGMQQVILALDELNLELPVSAPVDSVRRRTVPSIRPPLDSRVVRRRKQRRRWWTYAMLGAFALGVALVLLYDRLSSRGSPASPVPSSALVPASRSVAAAANPAPHAGASRGQPTTNNATQRLSPPSVGSGAESKPHNKKARQPRAVERPDAPRPSRAEASAGVRDESFGVESAPGSSEIGNPWPQ
ncbi:MAG TPA: serine/threonine-protein kinase, partial [Polyangiaceae bacterium]|nr:serine/threonine-protein kinase [Polyangiaceae bacterium]